MILRFVPLFSDLKKAIVVISFFIVALSLYLTYTRWGIVAIYAFSFVYAVGMLVFFFLLTKRYYIKLDSVDNKLIIKRPFRKVSIPIEEVSLINMYEAPKSYILLIETTNKKKEFNLSGSLSFEEPPFAPFLRKMHELKPTVGFGDFCINILHGNTEFKPWSSKMYMTYWSYIGVMIVYYLLMMLFVNILA